MTSDHKDAAFSVLESAHFSVLGWAMVLLYVGFNVGGGLLLKHQVFQLRSSGLIENLSIMNVLRLWKIGGALVMLCIGTAFWMIALSKLDLSRAFPVAMGLNILTVTLVSATLYGEPISVVKLIGMILILSGAVLLVK